MLRRAFSGLVSSSRCIRRSSLRSTPCSYKLCAPLSTSSSPYEFILTEKRGEKKNVGLVRMNRLQAMNALNLQIMNEMKQALKDFDDDISVGAIVITGSEKVFAAGADIAEMQNLTYMDLYLRDSMPYWESSVKAKKPIIAAVNGLALGGGCEVAMLCDIVYAGEKASFGQPEINLGVIPAGTGTQLLPRIIGKSKAMEMLLTGEKISAQEAQRIGIVNKVFPVEEVVDEAVKLGERISTKSKVATAIMKDCVTSTENFTLPEGVLYEKKLFQSMFATNDQKIGMTAFLEKKEPEWTDS